MEILEHLEFRLNANKTSFLQIFTIIITIIIIIIIITRPKPAYGRQGLAGGSLRACGAQLGSGK